MQASLFRHAPQVGFRLEDRSCLSDIMSPADEDDESPRKLLVSIKCPSNDFACRFREPLIPKLACNARSIAQMDRKWKPGRIALFIGLACLAPEGTCLFGEHMLYLCFFRHPHHPLQ
jgi:hypothetical protein